MGLWRAYRALNAEQKRVLKTKQIALNRDVDALIAMLEPIAAYDVVADKYRTPFGCATGLCIPILILLAFATANGVFPGRIGDALIIATVAVMLLMTFAWRRSHSLDLSSNLSTFVVPMLAILRDDVERKARVNLKLDLSPANSSAKLQSRSDPYERGPYHRVVESLYIDPWASAEMPLADGSILRWSIVDHVRERRQSKRNPRGKIKIKTKYTTKTVMDVELTLRNDAYAVRPDASERLKAGQKKSAIRVKARQKRKELGGLTPNAFLDVVAGLYRRATPARSA